MTRAWAVTIKDVQEGIRDAIKAERDANAVSLPDYMQGVDMGIIVGLGNQKEQGLPYTIRVLPPENTTFSADTTEAFEATMSFPVLVSVRGLDSALILDALREAVGLVIDGMQANSTLDGKVSGPADPAFNLSAVEVDAGEARQEVLVRVIRRN